MTSDMIYENLEGREAIDKFLQQHKTKKDFTGKVVLLSRLLKNQCKKGNVILVETKPGAAQYAVLSDTYNWRFDLKQVQQTEVKTLLPDDASDDYCKRYITSENKLKVQVIDCVKAVSQYLNLLMIKYMELKWTAKV